MLVASNFLFDIQNVVKRVEGVDVKLMLKLPKMLILHLTIKACFSLA